MPVNFGSRLHKCSGGGSVHCGVMEVGGRDVLRKMERNEEEMGTRREAVFYAVIFVDFFQRYGNLFRAKLALLIITVAVIN